MQFCPGNSVPNNPYPMDANGTILKCGDLVILPYRVVKLDGGDSTLSAAVMNVTLESIMPPAWGNYLQVLSANSLTTVVPSPEALAALNLPLNGTLQQAPWKLGHPPVAAPWSLDIMTPGV